MSDDHTPETAIAIVGLAARFPGAEDETAYWRMLLEGREGVTRLTPGQLRRAGVPAHVAEDPRYVPVSGVVPGIDRFDAGLFRVAPMAARLLDPQHRLLLHCAWSALEDAACDHTRFDGAIGVFAGQGFSDYAALLRASPGLVEKVSDRQIRIGTDADHLATRVAYTLGLTGPAMTVQTACSTSLTAVHLACQSLLDGQCELALAGGVSLRIPQEVGYLAEDGVMAADGHCRPFGAGGDGSLPSGGVGLVALKLLTAAERDGDPIRAVILGSAVNNDGSAKVGYTAPSVGGQSEVIAEALAAAGVRPGSIGFVEAHGTATPLGDPIEVAALTDVYRQDTTATGFCALGSVKSNIGHADAAAGVAGLIKAVLAVEHGIIPPSLNFGEPNPAIDFPAGPFYVPADPVEWPAELRPRRAAVSSFGLGGTNAHLVLEEAHIRQRQPEAGPQLLVLSAATSSALADRVRAVAGALGGERPPSLASAAATLRAGRAELAVRTFVTAGTATEAAAALSDPALRQYRAAETALPVAFVFPGMGAFRPGIAAGLPDRLPAFSAELGQCLAHLDPAERDEVRAALLEPGRSAISLTTTLLALFVLEYALAVQWRAWGVEPAVVAGHSAGEYTAACLAGVFDVPDALAVIRFRAGLIERLPAGRMLSLPMSEAEVRARLGDESDVDIAVVNGPSNVVVSGDAEAIERLRDELEGEGVDGRPVEVPAAGHSRLMDPAAASFREYLDSVRFGEPRIAFVSAISGVPETERISTPDYWVRHLREPVRFDRCLDSLAAEDGTPLFLEVGPATGTSTLVRANPATEKHDAVACLPREGDALTAMHAALGAVWAHGAQVSWPPDGVRARLPVYGFDPASYWIPDQPQEQEEEPMSVTQPADGETISSLREILGGHLGIAADLVRTDLTFVELGADSLILMQVGKQIEAELSVKVPFRQLLTKYPTILALAARIAEVRPPAPEPPPPPPPPAPVARPAAVERPRAPSTAEPSTSDEPPAGDRLHELLHRQLDIVSRQLALLERLAAKEGDPRGAARR